MLRAQHSIALQSSCFGRGSLCPRSLLLQHSPAAARIISAPSTHPLQSEGPLKGASTSEAFHRKSVVARNSPALSPEPQSSNGSGSGSMWAWGLGAAAVAACAALVLTSPQAVAYKDVLMSGPLGKSGFLAAFSLILLSEIGDKTFFIAAILAMKVGRALSFFASLTSLSLMSVISVGIGCVFSKVPDALKSSVPVGELAGIALLVFFGIRTLKEGLYTKKDEFNKSDEEMSDAEDTVAQWGDRSMLATIALGAAQNPVGVATGAIAGHAIATGIAVLGGAIAAKYVDEKTVNMISGVLFLVFAAATALSML
eukprot:gene13823-19740_t